MVRVSLFHPSSGTYLQKTIKPFYIKGFSLNFTALQQSLEVDDDDLYKTRKIHEASMQMSLFLRRTGIKHLRGSAHLADDLDKRSVTVLSVGPEACGRDLKVVTEKDITFPQIFWDFASRSLLEGPSIFETDRETCALLRCLSICISFV